MILTEKQQKYQHYHYPKLINMNILRAKKHHLIIKVKGQNKLDFHILLQEKLFKNKQRIKLILLKYLNLSNKIDQLKQVGSLFPKIQLNDLIIDKLKEIKKLQSNIKLDKLEYATKHRKNNHEREKVILITYCFQEMYTREICHQKMLIKDKVNQSIN